MTNLPGRSSSSREGALLGVRATGARQPIFKFPSFQRIGVFACSIRYGSQTGQMPSGNSEARPNRLLIVDDEPGITRVIEVAARELSFEVVSINDTDQFEKAIETLKPSIIFLDIAMPGRDGVELIANLAAANYPGRLVLMSGSNPLYIQMSSEIAIARGLWVAGTLGKPFRKQQVLDLLASLAGG